MFCHIRHLTYCFHQPAPELGKPGCQGEFGELAHTAKYAVCCISLPLVNPFCSIWGTRVVPSVAPLWFLMISIPVRHTIISGTISDGLCYGWVSSSLQGKRLKNFRAGPLNMGASKVLTGALGDQIPCAACRHRGTAKFLAMSQFSPAAIQWLLGKPPCFETTEGLQGMQQWNPAADWANNRLVKVLINAFCRVWSLC